MIFLTHNVKQTMKKKLQTLVKHHRLTSAGIALVVLASLVLTPIVVKANIAREIQELNNENAQHEAAKSLLSVEAANLEGAISALQTQINGLEAQIQESNQKIQETSNKIAEAEAELARQKDLLGQNLKAMYLEGDITTLEMLASSKDLSEFVDQQQYRSSVKDKIKDTLDKVTALKLQLNEEKELLEAQKKDQEARQAVVNSQRAEQAHLLGLNQSQRNAIDAEIRTNNAQIAELRRQQAIENAKIFGTAGTGAACGGGYPGSTPGPWGRWGCNHPLDNTIDNWGMYNRECVSYTAFKVAASGRYMPYWGGRGNANKWDDNARAAGYQVDTTPSPGDVAIINAGYYGHAMYVEDVLDDGRIVISHYNYDWAGNYQMRTIGTSGMVFITFP